MKGTVVRTITSKSIQCVSNTQEWREYCISLFAVNKNTRPWVELNMHPMRWASMQYRATTQPTTTQETVVMNTVPHHTNHNGRFATLVKQEENKILSELKNKGHDVPVQWVVNNIARTRVRKAMYEQRRDTRLGMQAVKQEVQGFTNKPFSNLSL